MYGDKPKVPFLVTGKRETRKDIWIRDRIDKENMDEIEHKHLNPLMKFKKVC